MTDNLIEDIIKLDDDEINQLLFLMGRHKLISDSSSNTTPVPVMPSTTSETFSELALFKDALSKQRWLNAAQCCVQMSQLPSDLVIDNILNKLKGSSAENDAIRIAQQNPFNWDDLWTSVEKCIANDLDEQTLIFNAIQWTQAGKFKHFADKFQKAASMIEVDDETAKLRFITAVRIGTVKKELRLAHHQNPQMNLSELIAFAECVLAKKTPKTRRLENLTVTITNPQFVEKVIDSLEKDADLCRLLEHFKDPESVPFPEDLEQPDVFFAYNNNLIYRNEKVVIGDNAELHEEITKQYHDHWTGGHAGLSKTSRALTPVYHWKGISRFIKSYVQNCGSCKKVKADESIVTSDAVQANKRFDSISIEVISGLSVCEGYTRVFIIIDHSSEFTLFLPCKDTGDDVDIDVMHSFFSVFGIPHSIASECRQFTSQSWGDFAEVFSIESKKSSVYQSKKMLETIHIFLDYCRDVKRHDWVDGLGEAMFAMNNTYQSSNEMTPYEAVFGREPDYTYTYRSVEEYLSVLSSTQVQGK